MNNVISHNRHYTDWKKYHDSIGKVTFSFNDKKLNELLNKYKQLTKEINYNRAIRYFEDKRDNMFQNETIS